MILKRVRRLSRALFVVAGLALATAGATAAAAAGPAGPAATSGPATSSSSSTGPSGSGSPSPSGSGAAGTATVMVRTGPLGSYLVNGQGRSLYLFLADKNGTSACSGQCATFWPPQPTTGTPKAGPGVNASLLGTITRSDGVKQVTYNKHPLYYFIMDKAPGDTKGQGLNNFGALWWLVSPTGTPVTMASASSAPSSPSASGNGGGGGGNGY